MRPLHGTKALWRAPAGSAPDPSPPCEVVSGRAGEPHSHARCRGSKRQGGQISHLGGAGIFAFPRCSCFMFYWHLDIDKQLFHFMDAWIILDM